MTSRARSRAAVVVPLHTRPVLSEDERISLRHLEHHLASHDRHAVAPEGQAVDLPGFQVQRFGRQYFGSAAAHIRLMLSREFYERFLDYECILIYHLDALVLSDQLDEWCDSGLDYVGAPWFRSLTDPSRGFSRVGNGGFSLRRVRSFLRVMDSRRLRMDPDEYWAQRYVHRSWPVRAANLPRKWLRRSWRLNGVRRHMARFPYNEDLFWADHAKRYDPGFRVATVETALRFAFEVAPRHCLELTGGRLPFGVHAWPSYDREFWEPHLLKGPSGEVQDPEGRAEADGPGDDDAGEPLRAASGGDGA